MSSNTLKVYLCTQKSGWSYECKMFDSFLEADAYYTKHYEDTHPKSTMISICKHTPSFLRPRILKYKLGDMHKVNLSV